MINHLHVLEKVSFYIIIRSRKSLIQVINHLHVLEKVSFYITGRIFFSYLTDFSYFFCEKEILKVARHGQNMSKMTILNGGVDGFSYFHWFSVILFSIQKAELSLILGQENIYLCFLLTFFKKKCRIGKWIWANIFLVYFCT